MTRKGILLAGGMGTRLYPSTLAISKQLLPVFDKPMIFYPISTLMIAGIRNILIITTPDDMPQYKKLLGNGSRWGISLEYAVQESPDGLAQALIIAEPFLNGSPSALILGDNIFYGDQLEKKLKSANENQEGASVFVYRVDDPKRYGVAEFNQDGEVLSIDEKPLFPKSKYAITGLYFYDSRASHYAKQISPSKRGELEITDLNNIYLSNRQLRVERMGRGYAWLDTGTHESLLEAHQFVQAIEHRQGMKIGCPEEVAFRKGWIDADALEEIAKPLSKSGYGQYLRNLITEI